jgi:hypothetical protein
MFPVVLTSAADGAGSSRTSHRRVAAIGDGPYRATVLVTLYEIADSRLTRREPAAFAELGLHERRDLQRIIREDVAVLGDELLVVAEEFGDWEDARRRIDLLAVDKTGQLVIVELKRDDSAHMDLQALRYAAMVASMDFEDVVTAHEVHLAKIAPDSRASARAELTGFLDDSEEPTISTDVRIVLVSGDFGRELMTAVLWLNRLEGMDIRCIQLAPYRLEDDRVLVDVRQVVPLPEAGDYQVRVRRKEQQERARKYNPDLTRYHLTVAGTELPDENKRNTMRLVVSTLIERGVTATAIGEVLTPAQFRSIEGELEAFGPAFSAADRRFDPGRWFVDTPYRSEGRTWLLSNRVWGAKTESTLAALCETFPQACVSFRRAEA